MNNKLTARLAIAAVAVSGAMISVPAMGDTILPSGDTIQGWKVTYVPGITLWTTTNNDTTVLKIVKDAKFQSNEGLVIDFTQRDLNASPKIEIESETIENDTGTPWNGFQFLLVDTAGGIGAQFHSAADTFKTITPFTTTLFDPGTVFVYGGGTLASGSQATFGGGAEGGSLLIDANPVTTAGVKANFALKELPSEGTGPSVPLPAAVWTSLTVLAGMMLVGNGKRIIRRLA